MKAKLLVVCLLLASTFTNIAAASPDAPKPLAGQVESLLELLSDGFAVGYPKATLIQTIKYDHDESVTLVVFTLEGFGGGNNWSQYLAVFSNDAIENGKTHFTLLDVMRIGGDHWRSIVKLNARSTNDLKKAALTFDIDALQDNAGEPPDYKSENATIHLLLKYRGRLQEIGAP